MGGVATIAARLIVFVYFAIQCKNVFNKDYNLQTSLLKRDLTLDTTTYNLTKDNFDIGLRLDYLLKDQEPEVWENLDQYVDLRVTQNTYQWVNDGKGFPVFSRMKTRATLGPCK